MNSLVTLTAAALVAWPWGGGLFGRRTVHPVYPPAPCCGAGTVVEVVPAPAPVVAPPKQLPVEAKKPLYERLGGEKAIRAVVEDFVGRAATDPKVNFFRKASPAEWKPGAKEVEALKQHLVDLIGQASGGPQQYKGRDMKASHRGMAITDAEFDALAADLKASLDHFKVPAAEQNELLSVVGSTRSAIVEKK